MPLCGAYLKNGGSIRYYGVEYRAMANGRIVIDGLYKNSNYTKPLDMPDDLLSQAELAARKDWKERPF